MKDIDDGLYNIEIALLGDNYELSGEVVSTVAKIQDGDFTLPYIEEILVMSPNGYDVDITSMERIQ